MNTIGYLLIFMALFIIRNIAKGRPTQVMQDLSDFFLATIQGDTAAVKEIAGRKGDALGMAAGNAAVNVGDILRDTPNTTPVSAPGGNPPSGYQAQIKWINAQGFSFHPTKGQTDGGTHAAGSYHYKGRAVDLSGDAATMLRAAKTIEAAFGPKITELIHTPLGYSIKNGKRVKPIDAAAHYNHVHWAE